MQGAVAEVSRITSQATSCRCATARASKSVLSRFSSDARIGYKAFGLNYCGLKAGAPWGVDQKGTKLGVTLNRTWLKSCYALQTHLLGNGDAPRSKVLRVPILDENEDGSLYFRDRYGGENLEARETGLSSSFERRGPPGGKPEALLGKSSSFTPTSLPNSHFRAMRLSGKKISGKQGPLYSKAARRFFNEKHVAEPKRLSKVLAAAGVASRRGCEQVIFGGRVAVNGRVCKMPQTPVNPLKDVIYVDGNSLPKKVPPKIYFALNKPKGYICSAGEQGTKPILSLFDDYLNVWAQRNPGLAKPRIFTVGRLDVATTGLLLVTSDGEFAHKVSHPSSGLSKEYVVTINERLSKRQLRAIANGTVVDGVQCVPKEVQPIPKESGVERHRLRIVVNEGRNHEVRNLVENSGVQVLALKRTRIGGLRLSRKLGTGRFDTLTDVQVANVLNRNLQNDS